MRQSNKFNLLFIVMFLIGCASNASYQYPTRTVKTSYTQGSDAYYQGNYQEAIKYFKQHIAENPDDGILMDMTLYNLANSYKEIGDKTNAIKTYQKLIDTFKQGYWVESAKKEVAQLKG